MLRLTEPKFVVAVTAKERVAVAGFPMEAARLRSVSCVTVNPGS
jgi:hypothetical protein